MYCNSSFIRCQLFISLKRSFKHLLDFHYLISSYVFLIFQYLITVFFDFIGKPDDDKRRKIAAVSIAFVCTGVLLLTSGASFESLPG